MFQDLVKTNRKVLAFFLDSLGRSTEATKYIKSRVSAEAIKEFSIGYSPKHGFVEFLNSEGISPTIAKNLGLVKIDKEGYAYPVFYNRLMFPIFHAGMVVGFAGRSLDGNAPKYLNSIKSTLYNKSAVLYGLQKNRKYITTKNKAIIVEGYMDVISLWEAGIRLAVATCGTSLHAEAIDVLRRYTQRVYLMLDGDSAGQAATDKMKPLLKRYGVYGGQIRLPNDLDPDEFIKKYGKNHFNKLRIYK